MQRPEHEFDETLRSHLCGALDAQRGRARAAFERSAQTPLAPSRNRKRWVIASIASGAIAATILLTLSSSPAPEASVPPVAAIPSSYVERVLTWRAVDEGPRVLHSTLPVRRVRYQTVEQIEFSDPDTHATIQLSIPREHVVLVQQPAF